MELTTKKVTAQKSQEEVFNFLIDLKNFEQLMPENIEKFEVDGNSFLFCLKGMPEIRLALDEKIPSNKIVLGAASSKLSFSLIATIDSVDDQSSAVQLFFKGDFNPMVAMMVKKPLQKFMDVLIENIEKL